MSSTSTADALHDAALDREVEQALKLACERLRLDVGIVSRIEGDAYEVLHLVAPDDVPFAKGQTFAVANTYCSLTVAEDGIVTIDDTKAAAYEGHPCYATSPVVSYVGIPFDVQGERFGTVNFSSATRRATAFGPAERELVELVASWVARTLDRQDLLEQLRQAAERFRVIFEGAPYPMFTHRNARVLQANPAAAIALGFDEPADLTDLPLGTFLAQPVDLGAMMKRLARLAEGKDPGPPMEFEIQGPEGNRATIEVAGAPIELPDGRAGLTVARDVTEIRRSQALLMQADRLASIGSLAAGVAHELNNPLTYVMANVDVVLEQLQELGDAPSPAQVAELVQALAEAREGADRARQIVRDLRSFSRLPDEARSPQDLHAALDVAINLAKSEARRRAAIIKDYAAATPYVDADNSRLTQVFVNLLVNAAQAIPEGAAESNRIRVSTRVTEEERVVVEVADTGTGIAKDALPRIFDAYFTTKPRGAGTGLGLALSYTIVTALGGLIAAANRPEGGAVFTVEFPLTGPPKHTTAPPPKAAPAGPRGMVLIVDDDVWVAKSLERALARHHEVAVVHGGRDALAWLDEHGERCDVILCDLVMPGMPGQELYRLLVEQGSPYAQRIVFITGGTLDDGGQRFRESVPNTWLEKPIEIPVLRMLIGERVRARRGANA